MNAPTPEAPPAPGAPLLAVGARLAGVFVLQRHLETGPDGEIWLAQDEVLGKDVSLHFLPEAVRQDERAVQELRAEVRRSRQLIHPGILRVFEFVQEPEWSAVSMDWLAGTSLAARLRTLEGGAFSPAKAAPWLAGLCQTLEEVHRIQVMHRHLTPANVFVDDAGKVVLAKFGLSRVIADTLARQNPAQAGAEQAYLSPQQRAGEPPTKQDDLYATGALIYELLTGTPPPLEPAARPSLAERRQALPQPAAEVPPAWERAVAACLAPTVADRPATAAQIAAALAAVSEAAPVPAAEPVAGLTPDLALTVAEMPAPTPVPAELPASEKPPVRRKGAALVGSGATVPLGEPLVKPGRNGHGGEPLTRGARPTGAPEPYLPPRRPGSGGRAKALALVGLIVLLGGLAWYFQKQQGVRQAQRGTPRPAAGANPQPDSANGGLSGEPRLTAEGTPSGPSTDNPASLNQLATAGMSAEQVREALASTEKTLQEVTKQDATAQTDLQQAQAQLDERLKQSATLLRDTEALGAQRLEQEEKSQTAAAAAQELRTVAEASMKAAQAKEQEAQAAQRALTTFLEQNQPKLTAREEAEADLQKLRGRLSDQQGAATEAARLRADTVTARGQYQARLRQLETGAAAAATPAPSVLSPQEQARLQVDAEMEQRRKNLEAKIQQAGGLPASTSAAATPTPRPGLLAPPALPKPTPIASLANATPAPAEPLLAKADPPLALPSMGEAANQVPVPGGAASLPQPPEEPTAPALPDQVKFTNSLGIPFAPVGETLFAIWPTRIQDYAVYAGEVKLRNTSWRTPGFKQAPNHPVVNVSWMDATAFCAWLTDREHRSGVLPKTDQYRLPTDAEWSTAVGLEKESGAFPAQRDLGVQDVFPWGTQWPPPPGVGNYTGVETGSQAAIASYDDGYTWTAPVGSFKANKYGLFDMGGNVWQWCQDDWQPGKATKVLRGASWYDGALKLSLFSSSRTPAKPDSSMDNHGFRIVRAKAKK